MPVRKIQSPADLQSLAPPELAGKWVAWNEDHTQIVGHGESIEEASAAAEQKGVSDPLLERVRRPDEILIGA